MSVVSDSAQPILLEDTVEVWAYETRRPFKGDNTATPHELSADCAAHELLADECLMLYSCNVYPMVLEDAATDWFVQTSRLTMRANIAMLQEPPTDFVGHEDCFDGSLSFWSTLSEDAVEDWADVANRLSMGGNTATPHDFSADCADHGERLMRYTCNGFLKVPEDAFVDWVDTASRLTRGDNTATPQGLLAYLDGHVSFSCRSLLLEDTAEDRADEASRPPMGDNTATPYEAFPDCADHGSLVDASLILSSCNAFPKVPDDAIVDWVAEASRLTLGDNTATPQGPSNGGAVHEVECVTIWRAPNLEGPPKQIITEDEDIVSHMQGLVQTRRVQSFAVACERGEPLLRVFQLSRRVFTPIWMQQGRDLAFEQYRLRESGLWEKKVLGWQFLDYSQHFGAPFAVHLRRTGLWSSQLISPFEDQGHLEMFFLTVFPQPMMLVVAGNVKTLLDSVVLALSPDAFASDMLPIVIEHSLNGRPEMGALRCPIACSPIIICVTLGFAERCQPPNRVRVYFRHEDIERVFIDYDRIGLPAGAKVQLSISESPTVSVCDLPEQQPFREHQTLIVPSSEVQTVPRIRQDQVETASDRAEREPVEADTFSMMQNSWQQAFALEDQSFVQEIALGNIVSLFPPTSYGNVGAIVPFELVPPQDVLRDYVKAQIPVREDEMLAIHTWVVSNELAMAARVCVLQPGRSLTRSFVLQWEDFAEVFPIQVVQALPQPPPLTLRTRPVDLIGLTSRQQSQGDKIFLLDVLFYSHPRRLAVRYGAGELMRDLVARAGLRHVCQESRFRCQLRWDDGENIRSWEMYEVVDQAHGAFLSLHFESGTTDLCDEGQGDSTSLVQLSNLPSRSRTALHRYVEQWFHAEGEAQFWIHSGPDVLVQDHPVYCTFNVGAEVYDQCAELWLLLEGPVLIAPVIPPPVFLVLPRPHILVAGALRPTQVLLLIQTFLNGRSKNLLSLLIDQLHPPTDVCRVFELADPQNDCQFGSRCHAVYQDSIYQYYHDIDLHEGTFVKLYENEIDEADVDDIMTCVPYTPSASRSASSASLLGEWHSQYSQERASSGLSAGDDEAADGGPDALSMFQIFAQPRLQMPENELCIEEEAVRRLQEDYLQRERMKRIVRATHFVNYDFLRLELQAMRAGHGVYPPLRLFGCECRLADHEILLAASTPIQREPLILHLRIVLQTTFSILARIRIVAVKPNPTPFQQGGEEAMCLLIGAGWEPHTKLAMVVATGIRDDIRPVLRGLRLPSLITTAQLFQRLQLFTFCHSEVFICSLFYDEQELPRYTPWQVIEGMRIDLRVQERSQSCANVIHDKMLENAGLADVNDWSLSLLQYSASTLSFRARGDETASYLLSLSDFHQGRIGRITDRRPLFCVDCCSYESMTAGLPKVMQAFRAFRSTLDTVCTGPFVRLCGAFPPFVCRKKVGVCVFEGFFVARSPMTGLPPPGNPEPNIFWRNVRLDCLDQWICAGDRVFIFDFPHAAICLADLITAESKTAPENMRVAEEEPRRLKLPEFRALLEALTTPIPATCPDLQNLYEQLPPDVLPEFTELILDPPTVLDSIALFTDGSYSVKWPDMAGWSVVVIGYQGNLRYLLDCEWGIVSTDPLDEGWTAAAKSDSKSAETQGLIRAIEWCFRHKPSIQHTFFFDSQTIGFSGSGAFKISQTDRQLRLLRGLACALDVFCGDCWKPAWQYVKAHANELGNEIADVLAKRAAKLHDESWNGKRPDYVPHVCGENLALNFCGWSFRQIHRPIR